METNTAKVDLKEFTFGILIGYIESMFDDNGKFLLTNKNYLKNDIIIWKLIEIYNFIYHKE